MTNRTFDKYSTPTVGDSSKSERAGGKERGIMLVLVSNVVSYRKRVIIIGDATTTVTVSCGGLL
jgi:hypothetical protein